MLLGCSLVLLAIPATPAEAITFSGTVVDSVGAPVDTLDLDLFDAVTGAFVFPTGSDDTNASGQYSFDVPAGTYDVVYNSPFGSRFFDLRLEDVAIPGNTVRNVTMPHGVFVEGDVRTWGGLGALETNLDFVDGAGNTAESSGDRTDATGHYRALVRRGVYSLQFVPKLGEHDVPVEMAGLSLMSDTNLGLLNYPFGPFVKGETKDYTGTAIDGLDVDALLAGVKIFTPRDDTEGGGKFQLTLAPGTYSLLFDPPVTAPAAALLVNGVVVGPSNDVELGVITLPRGYLLSGRVRNPSSVGVPGVDLDAYLPDTTVQVLMTRDDTDSNGDFDTRLQAGTYDITFNPPFATQLVGLRMPGVVINPDLDLGNLTLQQGVVLSGTAREAGTMAPVVGGDLDVRYAGTMNEVHTPGDNTNASGFYDAIVPTGVFDLEMAPPAGSPLPARLLTNVTISGNTTVDFTLGSTTAVGDPPISGSGVTLRARGMKLDLGLPVSVASVTLDVYDAGGRHLRRLWRGSLDPGLWSFTWDGRDSGGSRVAQGIYFVRAAADHHSATARVLGLW